MAYILTVDQSTTGTKAMLIDPAGAIVAQSYREHRQILPQSGWVEQDSQEIFGNTCAVIREILDGCDKREKVAALAITVQTGAFVVWDKQTGKPVYNIIGWQCNRGGAFCATLKETQKQTIYNKSGLLPSAFLAAAKLRWLLQTTPELYARAQAGEVLFGTIETFLIWKLTRGRVHASDYCNASITQLLNIHTLAWDDELLEIFDIPKAMLPALYCADDDYGTLDIAGLPRLPITGVIGDSAAALFAQGCFDKGDVKITYGTGASILFNIGDAPIPGAPGVRTSIGWRLKGGDIAYVWEGTVSNAGSIFTWLEKNLGLIPDPVASEAIAAQVHSANGVYFVPAFAGLGSPYLDENARACIVGMTHATNRGHIVRAALDCIAYQIRDIVCSVNEHSAFAPRVVVADGGVTKSEILMQFQADMLGCPVRVSAVKQASALGAARIAALALGLRKDKRQIRGMTDIAAEFVPFMGQDERQALYDGWRRAVSASQSDKRL